MNSNLQGSLPLPGWLDCQCGVVTMARVTQDVIANRVWLFAVFHLGTSSPCSRDCNGLHPLLLPFQKLCSFFYLKKNSFKEIKLYEARRKLRWLQIPDSVSNAFTHKLLWIYKCQENPLGKCIPSDAASLSGDKMVVWCVRMKVGIWRHVHPGLRPRLPV